MGYYRDQAEAMHNAADGPDAGGRVADILIHTISEGGGTIAQNMQQLTNEVSKVADER